MRHLLPLATLAAVAALGFAMLAAAQKLPRVQEPGLVDPGLTGGRR